MIQKPVLRTCRIPIWSHMCLRTKPWFKRLAEKQTLSWNCNKWSNFMFRLWIEVDPNSTIEGSNINKIDKLLICKLTQRRLCFYNRLYMFFFYCEITLKVSIIIALTFDAYICFASGCTTDAHWAVRAQNKEQNVHVIHRAEADGEQLLVFELDLSSDLMYNILCKFARPNAIN